MSTIRVGAASQTLVLFSPTLPCAASLSPSSRLMAVVGKRRDWSSSSTCWGSRRFFPPFLTWGPVPFRFRWLTLDITKETRVISNGSQSLIVQFNGFTAMSVLYISRMSLLRGECVMLMSITARQRRLFNSASALLFFLAFCWWVQCIM